MEPLPDGEAFATWGYTAEVFCLGLRSQGPNSSDAPQDVPALEHAERCCRADDGRDDDGVREVAWQSVPLVPAGMSPLPLHLLQLPDARQVLLRVCKGTGR